MPKGLSLHIGLNYVGPNHYQAWDGKLKGCEQDARDMVVMVAISIAAGQLKSGDTFLLTYSGHGGQVPAQGQIGQ